MAQPQITDGSRDLKAEAEEVGGVSFNSPLLCVRCDNDSPVQSRHRLCSTAGMFWHPGTDSSAHAGGDHTARPLLISQTGT